MPEVSIHDACRRGDVDAVRALIAAGFASTVEEAFDRIIGHGRPGYVRREGLGPEAAIEAIRSAGGLPVLAHFREAATRHDVLRELMDVGLGGLEVFYRAFDQPTVDTMRQIATANDLPADVRHAVLMKFVALHEAAIATLRTRAFSPAEAVAVSGARPAPTTDESARAVGAVARTKP